MGTVFLTNLAAVAGKYEQYDVLSSTLDFETHNHLPLKKLWLHKTLKKTLGRIWILMLGCMWLITEKFVWDANDFNEQQPRNKVAKIDCYKTIKERFDLNSSKSSLFLLYDYDLSPDILQPMKNYFSLMLEVVSIHLLFMKMFFLQLLTCNRQIQ